MLTISQVIWASIEDHDDMSHPRPRSMNSVVMKMRKCLHDIPSFQGLRAPAQDTGKRVSLRQTRVSLLTGLLLSFGDLATKPISSSLKWEWMILRTVTQVGPLGGLLVHKPFWVLHFLFLGNKPQPPPPSLSSKEQLLIRERRRWEPRGEPSRDNSAAGGQGPGSSLSLRAFLQNLNPVHMEEVLDEAFFLPGRRRTTRTTPVGH